MTNLPATQHIIEAIYLIASVLFILALKWMISPSTARRGILAGEIGMVLAIGGTLLHHGIVDYKWIAIALVLGTVIGIISAFQGIAATGSGGLGAVSAGISEALVETALGLVVAIPAVWMYNYFSNRLEYFNVEMDNSSSELVDYFIKKTA